MEMGNPQQANIFRCCAVAETEREELIIEAKKLISKYATVHTNGWQTLE